MPPLSTTPGRIGAPPAAQIVAEPGDNQRHMFELRAERLQLIERGQKSSARAALPVLRDGLAFAVVSRHQRRRQPILGRAGDQRHRAICARNASTGRSTSNCNCGMRLP